VFVAKVAHYCNLILDGARSRLRGAGREHEALPSVCAVKLRATVCYFVDRRVPFAQEAAVFVEIGRAFMMNV
jgi:hypothetical protein